MWALYDLGVVKDVAGSSGKWRDLGMQLLQPSDVGIIAQNHPGDVVGCCQRVLEEWLEKATDATWNQLIKALRSIELNHLAGQLEQMLTKRKNYHNIYSMVSRIGIMNS